MQQHPAKQRNYEGEQPNSKCERYSFLPVHTIHLLFCFLVLYLLDTVGWRKVDRKTSLFNVSKNFLAELSAEQKRGRNTASSCWCFLFHSKTGNSGILALNCVFDKRNWAQNFKTYCQQEKVLCWKTVRPFKPCPQAASSLLRQTKSASLQTHHSRSLQQPNI